MNAVLGPRPRKGASALCCFMRPVVGLRERPGFGAPFFIGRLLHAALASLRTFDCENGK